MGIGAAFAIVCALTMTPLVLLVLVTRYARHGRTRSATLSAPLTLVADVADGTLVKIVGRVKAAGRTVASPLSGHGGITFGASDDAWNPDTAAGQRPCVVWTVALGYFSHSRHGGTPVFIEKGRKQRGVSFFVADDSGQVLVHATRVSLEIAERVFYTDGEGGDALLAVVGIPSFVPDNQMAGEERLLREGDWVAVYGVARWRDDPAPDENSPAWRQLVIEPDPTLRRPVIVSDRD